MALARIIRITSICCISVLLAQCLHATAYIGPTTPAYIIHKPGAIENTTLSCELSGWPDDYHVPPYCDDFPMTWNLSGQEATVLGNGSVSCTYKTTGDTGHITSLQSRFRSPYSLYPYVGDSWSVNWQLVPIDGEINKANVTWSGTNPSALQVASFDWVLVRDYSFDVIRSGSGNPVDLTPPEFGYYKLLLDFHSTRGTLPCYFGCLYTYDTSTDCVATYDIGSSFNFSATASTDSYVGGQQPVIEPALGDSVTFDWWSSYFNPIKSLLLLRQNDEAGTIQPTNSSHRYESAVELPIGRGQYNAGSEWDYLYSDSVTWAPNTPQMPAGIYLTGMRFYDEHVELPYYPSPKYYCNAVWVNPTVTDVYTDTPLYPGRDTQGHTNIHYTLSSSASSFILYLFRSDPYDPFSPGTTITDAPAEAGENVYDWDGTKDDGSYCQPGVLQISVMPSSWPLNLTLSGASHFTPDDGESIQISYTIAEPFRRPQATQAVLYATIYDNMSGQIVKVLADGLTANVDNHTGNPPGPNPPLVWDGTDESGSATVLPGNYTIAFMAKDNAGIGNESALQTVQITVLPSSKPDDSLNLGQSDDDPTKITGWTQLTGTVDWSDSRGRSGSAPVSGTGDFDFTITSDKGTHTITASITKPDSTVHTETLNVVLADLSSTSPPSSYFPGSDRTGSGESSMSALSQTVSTSSEPSHFVPGSGETAQVTFTAAGPQPDYYDVSVLDPFNAPSCISRTDNPLPACTLLNGSLSTPKVVRKIWENHEVGSDPVTVTWDGMDDSGGTLPAGPYVIEVKRTNHDGLKYLSFYTDVTIDSTGTAPMISDVQEQVRGTTVAIAWKTDVSTTGAVVYATDGGPVGRIASPESKFHVAYLPVVQPNTTHYYWICASSPTGTAVSEKRSFMSGSGETFEDAKVNVDSTTTATVTWTSSAAAFGRIKYAAVGSDGTLNWSTATEPVATATHSIGLADLLPNSEYVFRLDSASTPFFTDSDVSSYGDFVTKLTKPQVEITSPEEGEIVSGTTTVMVHARDPIHRFEDNGVISVELRVDGVPVDLAAHAPDSDEYDFQVDGSLLSQGFHELRASATDDYWNTSTHITTVCVKQEQSFGLLDRAVLLETGKPDKIARSHMALAMKYIPRLPTEKNLALILVSTDFISKHHNSQDVDHAMECERILYEQKGYRVINYFGDNFGSVYPEDAFYGWFFKLFESGRLTSFTFIGHGFPSTDKDLCGTLDAGDFRIAANLFYGFHSDYHRTYPVPRGHCLRNMRLFSCYSRWPAEAPDQDGTLVDYYHTIYSPECHHSDSTVNRLVMRVAPCSVPLRSVTFKSVIHTNLLQLYMGTPIR